VVLVLLVVGAVIWIYSTTRVPAEPMPLPVENQDREIAWLYPATGTANWQRFVYAVAGLTKSEPGPEAFPRLTTTVPEIAIPLPNQPGKLRFRWYKLTSDHKAEYWMRALVRRDPPPLAIIGGNTTESATEQARHLRQAAADLPEDDRPLLLFTTATADRVQAEAAYGERATHPDGMLLSDIYRTRTFRFCFSNRQMGAAIMRFIWARDELRPDALPIYSVVWDDDQYSKDLTTGFLEALRTRQAVAAAGDWGVVTGFAGGGGLPLVGLASPNSGAPDAQSPHTTFIRWSVGGFDRPNHYEAKAAAEIIDHLDQHPRQKRALLILSGQSKPSRRFVRGLFQLSPLRARSFVLAAGDSISFNTILRDRTVTWNIQDLPCSLVLFCHQNPVGEIRPGRQRDQVSGTEDLLLYRDIVEALVEANSCGGRSCANASDLRAYLRKLRVVNGQPRLEGEGPLLFDADGNRQSGTGEHVVWLKPQFAGPPLLPEFSSDRSPPDFTRERVLPEATIRVFSWDPESKGWKLRGEPLHIQYTEGRGQ
jgi:hypothetical protein